MRSILGVVHCVGGQLQTNCEDQQGVIDWTGMKTRRFSFLRLKWQKEFLDFELSWKWKKVSLG